MTAYGQNLIADSVVAGVAGRSVIGHSGEGRRSSAR
jgi:hypothetical protein